MTYRALTRRRGTPLILKGPVTRRTPWSRVFRRMTRLPRNRPARRMRTVPGWRVFLGAQERMALRVCSGGKAGSQYMIECHISCIFCVSCVSWFCCLVVLTFMGAA